MINLTILSSVMPSIRIILSYMQSVFENYCRNFFFLLKPRHFVSRDGQTETD